MHTSCTLLEKFSQRIHFSRASYCLIISTSYLSLMKLVLKVLERCTMYAFSVLTLSVHSVLRIFLAVRFPSYCSRYRITTQCIYHNNLPLSLNKITCLQILYQGFSKLGLRGLFFWICHNYSKRKSSTENKASETLN
mgnify:FL=1